MVTILNIILVEKLPILLTNKPTEEYIYEYVFKNLKNIGVIMKFCKHCGAKLTDEDVFCPNCGNKVEKGDNTHSNQNGKSNSRKYWYIVGLVIVVFAIGGIALALHHQKKISTSSNSTSTVTSSSKSNSSKSNNLWDSSKNSQLKTFINSWAPKMNQSYAQLIKNNYSNKQFSNNTVNGSSTSLGWSNDGSGKYDYNVVAMYNYNKQGTAASTTIGTQHITYAFAFHDDSPIALVSETSSGKMNWTETKNSDVKSAFTSIATSNTSQTNSNINSSSNNDSNAQPSQAAIAVMAYMKAKGITDASTIGTLKETSEDGYNYIGVNGYIKYSINGDSVMADGQIYSLRELENELYKTSAQQQAVNNAANRIEGAMKDYGNGWSEYKNE